MNKKKVILFYEDTDSLRVVFYCLVINVKSINEKFGTLDEFVNAFNLYFGATNGHLYLLSEMMEPPGQLLEIIDNILEPIGMKEGKDFVLVYERLTRGVIGRPTPPTEKFIPECKGLNWLGSRVSNKGNFVWFKKTKLNKNEDPTEKWQRLLIRYIVRESPEKIKFNPRLIEVHSDKIIFGMEKHYGRLVLGVEKLTK